MLPLTEATTKYVLRACHQRLQIPPLRFAQGRDDKSQEVPGHQFSDRSNLGCGDKSERMLVGRHVFDKLHLGP
jgi:hypothetical protein